ncbi:ATPase domain-containing protein [Methanococcoides burtonii]|uniref:non-specific serine/threonine protein kinase n=1 Tax=Methanococcoides burtonii (strain DSM 6242 / NBRC 107633 / OCM 468 / ACE-M) TaxID=259564 RepID=Q12VV6_METBU|nr:ATPase domain-containing protein [Methanococcoides burtonii]ABE52420.1 KaiC domain-containing protein [Methanococcoides burtonii DSM 6242]
MSELQNLPCCIEGLDEILGGFKSPSTILVAGTAGVGKTTMALQMLSNAAKSGEKVLYIPLTTVTSERFEKLQAVFPFIFENISTHPLNRQAAEKDPLSTLIEMGNVITSENPDRIVIDPITPIGFGFVEQERRRFFYTLDSMLKESNALVMLTGELLEEQIHGSVVSHLTDGIIYLSKENSGYHTAHKLRVLKMLGSNLQKSGMSTSREYSYDVSSDGFVIYPRLVSSKLDIISETKIRSGVENFDLMLYGGMIAGNSMLVAGEPGAGKTIFSWSFIMEGLSNGENGVIVSYGERPEQIIREAAKFNWNMQQYVDSGQLQFIHSNPEEIHPAEHAIKLKGLVEELGITRIVVDGLVNLEITFPDNIKLRGYLLSLINYLKSMGVSSVFTTELDPQTGSIMSNEASFIMDSVVTLEQILCSNEVKRYLRVLKSKGSRHGLIMREYVISDTGIKLQCDVLP